MIFLSFCRVSAQGIRDFIIHENDTVNKIDYFNLKQGKWVFFLKDDFVSELKFYKKNQVTAKGFYTNSFKTGKWIYNYPDGKIKCEIFYSSGIPNGDYKFYDEKGKVTESGVQKNGEWTDCRDINGNKKNVNYFSKSKQCFFLL